ncbi:MAG TPA: phosphatase PAP2 family protein [Rhizomicrobium sp.]|nr:phosphatase PAP2 family protein [Rhizomicrobium sp.]
MIGLLPRVLLAVVAALIAVDTVWLLAVHIPVDWPAYIKLGGVSAAFVLGGMFYAYIRKDERLTAMLFGAAFLTAFSNAASVLNYLLLTVAGKRIDGTLAQIDRMIGVDWPAMIAWAGDHRAINMVLFTVYACVLPEVALLLPLLGWRSSTEKIYSFCFAIVLATVVTMGFWTFFPSFGAMVVYDLPHALLAHTPLQLDKNYANDLLRLLANGPGFITPKDLKGLIGFPSFHAVLALLVTWYARDLKYVRWPIIALNSLVLIATPFQGGHHVIDVVAGFAVAALAIIAADKFAAFAALAGTRNRSRRIAAAATLHASLRLLEPQSRHGRI